MSLPIATTPAVDRGATSRLSSVAEHPPLHGSFAGVDAGRQNNFDFLRFALAMVVLLSHSFYLLDGDGHREPFVLLSGGQLDGGPAAVNLFFVLSGFLVTHSWARSRGVRHYFRKRALRIYPGYLVAVAFCVLVVGPLAATNPASYFGQVQPLAASWAAVVLEGINAPRVFAANPFVHMNGSLWTIRYEFWCYVLVALLGLFGVYRNRALVLGLFVVLAGVQSAQVVGGSSLVAGHELPYIGSLGNWVRLLTCFASGMAFYLYRDRIPHSRGLLAFSLAVLVATGRTPWLHAALPVFGTYALLWLAFYPSARLQSFARRGDLSYGIYLYAYPVQQFLVLHLGRGQHPLALFALASVFTVGLAALSWRFVERPCLRLK